MGIRLPYIAFEREALKHLTMSPLQLYPISWAYVKVYQYWCEYLKEKSFVTLFFHLCKSCCDSAT